LEQDAEVNLLHSSFFLFWWWLWSLIWC